MLSYKQHASKRQIRQLQNMDESEQVRLSSSYATSPSAFMYLAEHGSVRVLKCIADNHSAPPAVLDAISSKIYSIEDHKFTKSATRSSIIISLTSNESSPPSLLERLSGTGIDEARHNIALHHNTPKSVLWEYYKDYNDESMCISLANGANTPPEILEKLSMHWSRGVMDCVTRNKTTPSNTLDKILLRAIGHSSAAPTPINEIEMSASPLEIIASINANKFMLSPEAIANIKLNKFIINIARNPNASADAVEMLSKLRLYPIDFALSANTRINEEISNSFIERYKNDANLLERLAVHTKFAAILERLSKSKFNNVRSSVAMNSNTPYKVIRVLEKDKDSGVHSIAHSRSHAMLLSVAKIALRKMLRSEPREGVIIG